MRTASLSSLSLLSRALLIIVPLYDEGARLSAVSIILSSISIIGESLCRRSYYNKSERYTKEKKKWERSHPSYVEPMDVFTRDENIKSSRFFTIDILHRGHLVHIGERAERSCSPSWNTSFKRYADVVGSDWRHYCSHRLLLSCQHCHDQSLENQIMKHCRRLKNTEGWSSGVLYNYLAVVQVTIDEIDRNENIFSCCSQCFQRSGMYGTPTKTNPSRLKKSSR